MFSLFSAFIALAVALPSVQTVSWSSSVETLSENKYEVVLAGKVEDGWHSSVEYSFECPDGVSLDGDAAIEAEYSDYKGAQEIEGEFKIRQKFTCSKPGTRVSVLLSWRSCIGDNCHSPEDEEFSVTLGTAPATASEQKKSGGSGSSPWGLILEAILWGLAMLLTPCVFPMVPMTISFFMHDEDGKAAGRFKALMYGVFIVLLYTLPISIIIAITRVVGGDAVTADIFNWLATHWLPNLVFFVVFMVFAASFFGAFEITLPSSLVNKSDRNSDKKGLLGVFFMALTLVLVSFSCTGPIVGTVLIKSTQGEFWTPMVTMLAFSVAFALPFTVLALFPSLLKKLPKSSGWLNSVKVVLGFIEIALGLKFLSTADQTYHWGILDREVYLAIWIVCFTLLGFYLLGKIRFRNDSPVEYLSVKRLALSIAVFSFVVYLIPGMWGAPLKALSGYMPPVETQDFVMGSYSEPAFQKHSNAEGMIDMPHGLRGYTDIDAALAAAKESGKPVFVDITGHGCVNCREMEARVWSDPKVLSLLKNEYVLVALYTDDKAKLPESRWIKAANGKILKDVGRVNSYIARERFGVNAQPNYALLDSEGSLLAPVRGYDLDVDGFVAFLKSGLK